MKQQATFNTIKKECLAWHNENRDNIWMFFWQLREDGAVYSPSLGIAVLWCEWKSGDEIVDRTFEVVLDLTPARLMEHVEFLSKYSSELGGWDVWATDVLAGFDHYTFALDEEKDVVECILVLSAICTASDWTSNPGEIYGK